MEGNRSKRINNADALLVDFFVAISSLSNDQEARLFLSDLLSNGEVKRLARRLRIAILLSSGYSYSEIKKHLKVGVDTIANVSRWLEYQGKGYEIVMKHLRDLGLLYDSIDEINRDLASNKPTTHKKNHQSKYADCFWPAELISALNESLVQAKEKQRNR